MCCQIGFIGKQTQFVQSNIVINYNDDVEAGASNIRWTECAKFTAELGIKQIEQFILTWKRDNAWLHCIDHLGEEEHDYDKRYKYRVRWSIPTRRKPIPRATACVYFTIYVSKIKPEELPVEVFYVFEGNRLVHRPGKSKFREIWLKNIIESKVLAMEQVTF
ncbi:A-kinase anchor protein 14-like isoform X2 [Clavelina lepadiformis]|uniref:A-kinase anchor protein 14 n=1 Tax=Clavelina lepadiformis TaxID=159417 RepID=A0ABP0GBY5_CLALP